MEPKDWIALAAVASTVVIFLTGLFRERWHRQREEKLRDQLQQRDDEMRAQQQQREERLRDQLQQREDEMRAQQQQREEELRERHREDAPHIEFGLDCQVHGKEGDESLIEFILTADNKGLVRQEFTKIELRVRGIESGKKLMHWQGYEPRLDFPVKVIDHARIIPPSYNFIFVEPGVKQTITYVTKMPASIKYILARVEFEYDKYTPHAAEKAFRVN